MMLEVTWSSAALGVRKRVRQLCRPSRDVHHLKCREEERIVFRKDSLGHLCFTEPLTFYEYVVFLIAPRGHRIAGKDYFCLTEATQLTSNGSKLAKAQKELSVH